MLTWVVGRGGLLGSAVARSMPREFVGSRVPWGDPARATGVLEADLARFAEQPSTEDWALVWAAGSGVVGSTRPELEAETTVLQDFVARVLDRRPAGRGAFFLASSAGGAYAGSSDAPFTESTTPRPLSPYGEAKLAQEELVTTMLSGRLPVVVGRLANLVGPGQNLAKPQGLVSQLCLAAATRRAVSLFVPMETLRDYLDADDAAAMVRSLVARAVVAQPGEPVLRNLASGRPVSVATVVSTVQHVARRTVRVALGANPSSKYQVRDLRLGTDFPADFDGIGTAPFPVMVKRVYDDVLRRVRNPQQTSVPALRRATEASTP